MLGGGFVRRGESENFLKRGRGVFNGGGGGGGIFQKSEKHDRKYDKRRRIRVLLMDF